MPLPAKERDQVFSIRALRQCRTEASLCCRLSFVHEPANIPGFHWIQRYDDSFDVTAFGAVERAKLESCRPRRNVRWNHARSAFRAAESLNSEQWDCRWVFGHRIPPSRSERKPLRCRRR
jgi:hypothetical protein